MLDSMVVDSVTVRLADSFISALKTNQKLTVEFTRINEASSDRPFRVRITKGDNWIEYYTLRPLDGFADHMSDVYAQ